MKFVKETFKADSLLLLASIIWGFAFVAQRNGMEFIGPFAFSAARFGLGALALLPVVILRKRREERKGTLENPLRLSPKSRTLWAAAAGTMLCLAVSFQQIGLVSTTAGNAGFITCLYVVLVPMVGFLRGNASGIRIWIGALLALVGLYVLSIGTGLNPAPGDLLELIGAFFWAGHILVIGHIGSSMDTFELSVGQFATCSLLSFIAALIREPDAFAGLIPAAIPILYGGLLSTCLAYPLQIIGQRTAHPAHASIILSMEALFAAIGGVIILHEPTTARLVIGGLLMFTGMICSQFEGKKATDPEPA